MFSIKEHLIIDWWWRPNSSLPDSNCRPTLVIMSFGKEGRGWLLGSWASGPAGNPRFNPWGGGCGRTQDTAHTYIYIYRYVHVWSHVRRGWWRVVWGRSSLGKQIAVDVPIDDFGKLGCYSCMYILVYACDMHEHAFSNCTIIRVRARTGIGLEACNTIIIHHMHVL